MTWAWVAVVMAFVLWPRTGEVRGVQDDDGMGRGRRRGRGAGRRAVAAPSADAVNDAILLVATGLRSPLPLEVVLERVAELCDDPVRTELRRVSAALRWGVAPAEAWGRVSARWEPLAATLEISERAGIPASGALLELARRRRQEEADAVAEQAARVGVRLVLPLGAFFLPAFVLMAVVPLVVALGSQLLS